MRHETTKLQTATVISCGFEVSSGVLNIIVIGHHTINIPEIFHVFTVRLA